MKIVADDGGSHMPPAFNVSTVVSVYTRAQALSDGVLIDATEIAREAGFHCSVAITRSVWEDITAGAPRPDLPEPPGKLDVPAPDDLADIEPLPNLEGLPQVPDRLEGVEPTPDLEDIPPVPDLDTRPVPAALGEDARFFASLSLQVRLWGIIWSAVEAARRHPDTRRIGFSVFIGADHDMIMTAGLHDAQAGAGLLMYKLVLHPGDDMEICATIMKIMEEESNG